MAKVFRLHEGPEGSGWFTSKPLTSEDLRTIKTGGNEVATSIPSPYARIDLVKSAFRWVSDNGTEGKTAHHQLVSDALDVAQLFFLSKRYSSKIEIIACNPKARFKKISEEGNIDKHVNFARTLQLYWEQDCVRDEDKGNRVLYNFENVKRLYLVINKLTKQVIGGTSPATLFFAAPDARKVASSLKITNGHHKLFENEFESLAVREPSFIKYIYALSKQSNFANYFPEFYSYLERVRLESLKSDLRSIVTNIRSENISQYPNCQVLNNPNDTCEILGIPIGNQVENELVIGKSSDFVIKNDLQFSGQKPLVLPYDKFTHNWTYTTEGVLWNESNQIPAKNTKNQSDSILPVQEVPYYWLSLDNFLEEKIIELPYSIDSSKFNLCGAKKYLLPLTPTFFKFFKAESTNQYLKLHELAGGGIEVKLEIPVKRGTISFKKIYHDADKVTLEAHLAIIPFIRTEVPCLDYTLGVIDEADLGTSEIVIECFEKGDKLLTELPVYRNSGIGNQRSYYFKSKSNFDLLRINIGVYSGIVIPQWISQNGGVGTIRFAIDFGTTNTHIEYKYGGNDAVPLNISNSVPLWQSLMNLNDPNNAPESVANEKVFENEIMPYSISPNKEDNVRFPIRTALVYNKSVDFNKNLELFRHINNYFFLEKSLVPRYLEVRTQLKWSNYSDPKDEKLVESYIEFLVMLVFYKTLMLGGDPSETIITWFYPVSMDEYEKGVFFRTWKKAYKAIFKMEPVENRINGIPESIAPYLYYKSSIIGLSLSIDIGGGSTDIAVFDENSSEAKIISSFKFAGNALFGDGFPADGYRNNSDRNGFVNTFVDSARKATKDDQYMKLLLEHIINDTKESSDFSSLLFSFENDKRNSFSYTRLLEGDKRLKLSILIFYAAVAYYSANLIKRAGLKIPKNILLSGTASKTASILDPTHKFLNLSGLFKFIFEKVFESQISSIKLELSSIPKEITCKGALSKSISESITQTNIKFWIGGIGNESEVWGKAIDKEKDIRETPKYQDIDPNIKLNLEKTIKEFYSILDDYVKSTNLEGAFNIELQAYSLFKGMRDEDIKEYLLRGIKSFYKKDEQHIEETLFFYPLIGILNKLSFELSQNKSK